MLRKNISESSEPVAGCLDLCEIGTAQASPISRTSVKWGCAREWGGWGRLSDDGPGQQNPDRSEGPWGRAAGLLSWRYSSATTAPTPSGNVQVGERGARRKDANQEGARQLGASYWAGTFR